MNEFSIKRGCLTGYLKPLFPQLNSIALRQGWVDAEVSHAFQYAVVAGCESDDIGETAQARGLIAVGSEVRVVAKVKRFDPMIGETRRL